MSGLPAHSLCGVLGSLECAAFSIPLGGCTGVCSGIIAGVSNRLPSGDFPSEEELRPKVDPVTGIDLSLIEENLKLTPWERILANDDAVNFGHMLREAVIRANAAS